MWAGSGLRIFESLTPRLPWENSGWVRILDDIQMPGRFNHKGYEYAFRVKGVVYDTILTLNAFYGYENSPIVKFADPANPFPVATVASDGKLILHPNWTGKVPPVSFHRGDGQP